MPVRLTYAEDELGSHEKDATGQDEIARPVGVEDGTDLDACEEREEGIDTEDPADVAFGLGSELVGGEIGMVGANCVHHS